MQQLRADVADDALLVLAHDPLVCFADASTHKTLRSDSRHMVLVARIDIDPLRRERLLHSYDEIAITLMRKSKIAELETGRRVIDTPDTRR